MLARSKLAQTSSPASRWTLPGASRTRWRGSGGTRGSGAHRRRGRRVWALRLIGSLHGWLGPQRRGAALLATRDRAGRGRGQALRARRSRLDAAERWWGPMPIDEAIRFADEAIATTSSKRSRATPGSCAGLPPERPVGSTKDGRSIATGRALLRDLGTLISWAGLSAAGAEMELGPATPSARTVPAGGREVSRGACRDRVLTTVKSIQALGCARPRARRGRLATRRGGAIVCGRRRRGPASPRLPHSSPDRGKAR